MAEQTALRQLISEPTALMDVEDLAGYTESNPLPVDDKDRQEAVRELGRRGITPPPEQPASAPEPTPEPEYKYGGDTFMGGFMPIRREILRPEYTQFVGFDDAGNSLYQEFPAVYGEAEYDPAYAPLSSAVSAGIDAAKGIPSFFGLRGPDAQVEAMNTVGSSLRDMLFGTGEYIADQATAAMSGGAFFDPDTQSVVRFDPTIAMVGGNPATGGGAVLASGVRAPRVRPFQQYGGNLEEARNRLNITEESRKAWQATRSGFKQERPEELRIAAQKVADGEMTFDEYRALVQEVLPPERIGQLMDVPTFEEIALGLDKNPQNTAGIIGFNINIPDGTAASSRLDINAYENQGVWVNTIHEGGKQSGSVLGYGPTTVLNNVTFSSNPKQALEIAMGKSKTPIGRIDGTWENRDPKLVVEQVRSILDGTAPDAGDWVEVGMNPIRGSGFYNKATFELVGESDQILQVGPVVLAKRPTYIQPNDLRNRVMDKGQPRLDKKGNPIFFSGGGNTGTAVAAGSSIATAARSRPDFDLPTTYYHGTSSDFTEFTPSEVGDLGPGIYMTPNPEKASGYAAMRRFMRRDTNNASPNVMPLRLRKDLNFLDLQGRAIMPFDEDRIQRLRDSGYDGIRQLDESGNVTQLNIFDPENIRSVNAEFKPGESANILYSGGNTGTGIAVASALRNELERRLGGPIPEVDRDTTWLGRLGDIKRINEMNVEMSAPQLASFPIARAEDLIDRAYITGISDTSRSGLERVTAVDGVPVDSLQRGGFAFGMQPENVRRGRAFASAANATTGQINRARAAQALSGRPGVLFIPHGMGGTSPDFATMSTDIAIPYAQNVLSRSDKRDLDRRIREGAGTGEMAAIPDWVGIDKATPEYLSSLGGERKQVLKALDEKPAQAAGALSRGQVRAIVTEPSEFNAPFGQVNAFYELDPRYYRENNPLIPGLSDHPSYARVLSGSPIGLARQGFSIFDLNPSIFGVDGREAVDFMEELALRRRGAQQRFDDALVGQGNVGKARSALAGYDFPGLYGDGGFGTSIQGMLRAGGQGVITQAEVDDLLRRGLIID